MFKANRNFLLSDPVLFNLGAQLLQDYQATHGPEKGEEEAAVTKLPPLSVYPGLCVRYASGI